MSWLKCIWEIYHILKELHDVMLKDLQSLKLKVIDHFNLLSILFYFQNQIMLLSLL